MTAMGPDEAAELIGCDADELQGMLCIAEACAARRMTDEQTADIIKTWLRAEALRREGESPNTTH